MYAVESKIGPRLFSSQKLVQGWVKNWSKMFSLFCPNFIVLGVLLKSHIVCKGARIIFAGSRGVKKGIAKMWIFVFVFLCWRKRKDENLEKKISKKGQEKQCFLGGFEDMFFFVKMEF